MSDHSIQMSPLNFELSISNSLFFLILWIADDHILYIFSILEAHHRSFVLSEAKLHGADIASVDMDLLDTLQITTLDEREHLLSAIYNKLHPPTAVTQRLDSLLGTQKKNVRLKVCMKTNNVLKVCFFFRQNLQAPAISRHSLQRWRR